MFGHQVFIVLRPERYGCRRCEDRPTTTQTLDWYTPRSRLTKAFEQEVLLTLINSTVEDVSRKQALGADAIEGVLKRYVAEQVDWSRFTQLPIIGVDEIALKKGHRDFVTVVSARLADGQLTILAILADRTKATVKAFFKSIPKRLRATVELVCSDLYAGFLGAAKAVFGRRVAVCADRFHVAKLYRDGVESLRKKEMRRLKGERSKTEYESLKNVHWILRKSDADLSADERRIRRRVFELSPKLHQAHALSEALTAIYEAPLTKGQGKRRLRAWIRRVTKSGLSCFNRFIKTLTTHLEIIANYFISRQTSGFVEGLNNKIKVLKRRGYGFTNRKRLFQRVYLDLHGYALFG
jgi:transposase